MIRFLEAALELASARVGTTVSIHAVYSKAEVYCDVCGWRTDGSNVLEHKPGCPVGYVIAFVARYRELKAKAGPAESWQDRTLELTLDEQGWPDVLTLDPVATVVLTHEEAAARKAAESPFGEDQAVQG